MRNTNDVYNSNNSVRSLREAGAGSSNLLTLTIFTNKFNNLFLSDISENLSWCSHGAGFSILYKLMVRLLFNGKN